MTDRDWGSDTLARFRYQAEVTLPYCLSVLSPHSDIQAVVPEHLEDIALRTDTGWRFIQVKTRNPERGLWTASDLFAKNGGALRSLYRTYLLTANENHSLELLLEGAVKPNDPIQALYPDHARAPLIPLVAKHLRAAPASAEDFLRRVSLNDSMHHRSAIHATNARLLHDLAPSLTRPALEALHTSLLTEIEQAMRCEALGPLWPRSVLHPRDRPTTITDRLRRKTLDAARLAPIAPPISGVARPLLRRFVEPASRVPSPLVQKLLLGGAPPAIVDLARNLQANARHQRFERASLSLADQNDVLADLQERILTHAQTAAALRESSDRPATAIWHDLLGGFHANAAHIDRHNLVHADPMLLMGEACILSDDCLFDWGRASDA